MQTHSRWAPMNFTAQERLTFNGSIHRDHRDPAAVFTSTCCAHGRRRCLFPTPRVQRPHTPRLCPRRRCRAAPAYVLARRARSPPPVMPAALPNREKRNIVRAGSGFRAQVRICEALLSAVVASGSHMWMWWGGIANVGQGVDGWWVEIFGYVLGGYVQNRSLD
jgi:hypothetical protein